MQTNSNNKISIIPQPAKIKLKQGYFKLKNNTIIFTDPSSKKIAEFLKKLVGLPLIIKDLNIKDIDDNTITMKIIKEEIALEKEGYILEIFPNKIEVSASTAQGIFYGIHTLRQLLPIEIEISSDDPFEFTIPCVIIEDYPRFSWRGFMLDESRHFFGKENVIKILDIMASLKFNTFHWHLTDDQGWRIEIKKYPGLTEIGSKRKGTINYRKKLDGIPITGYYSQADLKNIIDYASERYIRVIPEIDVPGHVLSVLASYPELSCTGGPFEVSPRFGIFKEVLCIGKEKVFDFLEDVLEEVLEIFPSKIIHTGGDEVPKKRWKKCPDCQARIKKEGLNSEKDLQVYFTNRISRFLKSKGRTLIGWNEILDKKLNPDAIGQYWYDNYEQVIEQVKNGRMVVMSEVQAVYLNYPYNETPLSKTYEYDPIPKELDKERHKQILGLEACLWTEYVKNQERLEWLVFPRLIAVAESGWALKDNKNYKLFLTRLDSYLKRLSILKINYAPKDIFMK